MLDNNEEINDRVKELEDKLEALRIELELSYDDIEELRDTVEDPAGEGFTDVQHGQHNFQVHWVKPEETESYAECADIDNIEKARIAFKEAAIKRDSSDHHRPVNQGDVLFLMCDTAPEPEPDPDNPDATPPDVPACSFIGMCAKIDFRTQLENPDTALELTQSQLADGEPYREFFAWDSCGGAALTGGHTGDETHRRLDVDNVAVNYSAGCQDLRGDGNEKRVTVTVPIFERDFKFQDGLLKEISDETGAAQGLTIEFFIPCGGGGDGDFGCEQIEICDGVETKTIYVATHLEACP